MSSSGGALKETRSICASSRQSGAGQRDRNHKPTSRGLEQLKWSILGQGRRWAVGPGLVEKVEFRGVGGGSFQVRVQHKQRHLWGTVRKLAQWRSRFPVEVDRWFLPLCMACPMLLCSSLHQKNVVYFPAPKLWFGHVDCFGPQSKARVTACQFRAQALRGLTRFYMLSVSLSSP